MALASTDTQLPETDIHHVLSNTRRRLALQILRETDGPMSARALSERIAEHEVDETPAPRNVRNSVYVSLHQSHLPKLDDLGIIEYDPDSKQVELRERAADVYVYMETVPKYGLSWSEFHLGVSLLGLLTMTASHLGVPLIARLSVTAWGTLTLGVIALTTAIQTYQQDSSIIHRLRTSEQD